MLVSRHKIYDNKESTDTTVAVSNRTKSKVLSLKKLGERYNETIFRICSEYESVQRMPVNAIQR